MSTITSAREAIAPLHQESAWLLEFSVAIKLPIGEVKVAIHNGPFPSRNHALNWHETLKRELAGKRVSMKRWEVRDGGSRGQVRSYERAMLTGNPQVSWVRRSQFTERKDGECTTRGIALLSTTDVREVALNIRQIALERLAPFLSQ